METFVLLSFWVLVAGFVIRVLIMSVGTYPRKVSYSLGIDTASMVFKIPFILWCAYLLWGQ